MARGHKLTFLAEEGRVVNGEEHAHGRLVDSDRRQRLGVLIVADSVTNLKLLKTDNGTDVAAVDMVCLLVAHTLEGVKLLDTCLLLCAVTMADGHVHAVEQGAAVNTSHSDTARVRAIVER